jgi:ABC-2 type transport system ATP-binding protein
MLAIETEHLSKDYRVGFWRPRPRRALHDLTLQIRAGEVFGFLGPNGSGKSTTLKLLIQAIYPTAGVARILGRPVGNREMKRRIGFLPEHPTFYDDLTAEELLRSVAGLFALPDRERRTAAVLDEVGIGAERRLRLRALSKGTLQRVGIAQAILNEPDVVFFDEPMSGLDPIGRRDVRQLMLRLRDRGCTVFFSSHILSDAEAVCTQVGILAHGQLRAAGTLASLVSFERRGWELVLSAVPESLRPVLDARARQVTRLSDDRFALELTADQAPEPIITELVTAGARVLSLNPIAATLEESFLQHVRAAELRDTREPSRQG